MVSKQAIEEATKLATVVQSDRTQTWQVMSHDHKGDSTLAMLFRSYKQAESWLGLMCHRVTSWAGTECKTEVVATNESFIAVYTGMDLCSVEDDEITINRE